jgi:periplasmic protein CpxP/Spy
MSTPTKSKLYLLIIGILLITNIVMLFFLLDNKTGDKRGNRGGNRGAMMKGFLQKEIGFNDQQLQQYDTLSKQQREKMKADFEAIKNNKEKQFKELGSKGFSDSVIADIVNQSAEKQKTMEMQMLNHFAEIRKICTAEQQPKFDSLFYKIWSKKKTPEEKK